MLSRSGLRLEVGLLKEIPENLGRDRQFCAPFKLGIFWICSQKLINLTVFEHAFRFHRGSNHRPDDGGSTHLWNVGLLQKEYTLLYPRRLSYSNSPWAPEISHNPMYFMQVWNLWRVQTEGEDHIRRRVVSQNYEYDDGGSRHLWNVGPLLDYTALYSRRLSIFILPAMLKKLRLSHYAPWRRLGGGKFSSYSFSTSALDGGEWSASRPGRALVPGKGPRYPMAVSQSWSGHRG
jgi:hypothetical protein